jgi:hypothetical protein
MSPDDVRLSSFRQVRLRLLPELAALAGRVAHLRGEREELTRLAESLGAQVRDLQRQFELDQERLLARGTIAGAAIAGFDGFRRRRRARLEELVRRQAGVFEQRRAVEAELARCFAELGKSRRHLDVIGERIEQRQRFLSGREADARLEELVEDCQRIRR